MKKYDLGLVYELVEMLIIRFILCIKALFFLGGGNIAIVWFFPNILQLKCLKQSLLKSCLNL